MKMTQGAGNMNDGVKNKLAKASGSAPKRYPKTGNGKDLGWKKPNTAGGKGVNRMK